MRKDKENRQKAQDLILEAHNLEATGKKEAALKKYEAAYALWKDNFDLIMKTASLQYSTGRYAKCYYFAGQALKLNPKNSEAALFAAVAAASMGKVTEAGHLFEMAINARPVMEEAFFNYALFLKKQKDYAGAQAMYQKEEQLFGPSLSLQMAMAGLDEIQGNDMKACNQYKEILKSGFPMDKKTVGIVQHKIRTLCNQGD